MNCIIIALSYQSIMLKNKQLEHLNKIYITLHRKIMNSCCRLNEQWRILSLICIKTKKKSNKQLQNIFRTSHKISLYNTPHLGKLIKTWFSSSLKKIFLFHTFLFINLSMKPLGNFPPPLPIYRCIPYMYRWVYCTWSTPVVLTITE